MSVTDSEVLAPEAPDRAFLFERRLWRRAINTDPKLRAQAAALAITMLRSVDEEFFYVCGALMSPMPPHLQIANTRLLRQLMRAGVIAPSTSGTAWIFRAGYLDRLTYPELPVTSPSAPRRSCRLPPKPPKACRLPPRRHRASAQK